jgi:hypothetical protein
VPHRCSFDQISIDAAVGSAVSRASATPFLPDAGTTTCSNSGSYFSCIASHSASAYSAKTLHEVCSSRPGDPLGPGPGRLFAVRHEHQLLSCFAARALRSDVGCQDLSILL